MAFKAIALGTEGIRIHIVGDNQLKKKIIDMIANQYQRHPDFKQKLEEYKKILLNHPYIHFDPSQAEEHTLKCERYNKCKKRLNALIVKIEKNEIKQIYPPESTGQVELTSKKLKEHSVKVLDINDNFLLISVERHPGKGLGPVMNTYWLHNEKEKTLRLLGGQYQLKSSNELLISNDGVHFSRTCNTNELDYVKKVKDLLGPKYVKRINQLLEPQIIPLIEEIPDFVDTGCYDQINELLSLREKKASQERNSKYISKYGEYKGKIGGYYEIQLGSIKLNIERPKHS